MGKPSSIKVIKVRNSAIKVREVRHSGIKVIKVRNSSIKVKEVSAAKGLTHGGQEKWLILCRKHY